MRYAAAFIVVALLHAIVLCHELPDGSTTKRFPLQSKARPRLTLVAPSAPEEAGGSEGERVGGEASQPRRAEQHSADPSGFLKIVEPGGETKSKRPARRGGGGDNVAPNSVPPLSIEWPRDPNAVDEVIRQYGMVVLAVGADGKTMGCVPSVADSHPPQPWTGTSTAMSNRVRTIRALDADDGSRFRLLVPAEVDAKFVKLQASALAASGIVQGEVIQQTGAFQKTATGEWELVITETVSR